MWRKKPKLFMWRKNDKYEVCLIVKTDRLRGGTAPADIQNNKWMDLIFAFSKSGVVSIMCGQSISRNRFISNTRGVRKWNVVTQNCEQNFFGENFLRQGLRQYQKEKKTPNFTNFECKKKQCNLDIGL